MRYLSRCSFYSEIEFSHYFAQVSSIPEHNARFSAAQPLRSAKSGLASQAFLLLVVEDPATYRPVDRLGKGRLFRN